MALLAARSCPKGQGTEEKFDRFLLQLISPALRPVARWVLQPECALAKRLWREWPNLALHLRLSSFAAPSAAPWSAAEVDARAREVKGCRDRLLAKDFTAVLMPQLAPPAGPGADALPRASD